MVLAGTLSLTVLDNATQAFNILLLSGAGSGAIYLLRWFWWRINALTEIVAMIVATVVAFILVFAVDDATVANSIMDGFTMKMLIAVVIVSISWVLTTLFTEPEDKEVLRRFYKLTKPGGPGWKKVVDEAAAEGHDVSDGQGVAWQMPRQILLIFIGSTVIYTALFSIGGFVYGNLTQGTILGVVSAIATVLLFKVMSKLNLD